MYQQSYNNYYPQPQNQQRPYGDYNRQVISQPQPIALKGRMVSSIEEARAMSIDFDGSIFYFPDLANKCIYTKQINMDGTATINMYELKPMQNIPAVSGENYVTRQEFEQIINQIKNILVPAKNEANPQAKSEILNF